MLISNKHGAGGFGFREATTGKQFSSLPGPQRRVAGGSPSGHEAQACRDLLGGRAGGNDLPHGHVHTGLLGKILCFLIARIDVADYAHAWIRR